MKIIINIGWFTGLCIILFAIFAILKLCGVIAWSWLYVCMPLIVLAGIIGVILIFSVFAIIIIILAKKC